MAVIGKLFFLKKESGIDAYAMSDTHDIARKKYTDWVKKEAFENPFLLLEESGSGHNYWVKILIGDKTGWIHIDKEQLHLIKT